MKPVKKMGLVVSAFPGMGKSYCVKNKDNIKELSKYSFSDSDSSLFSWIANENGEKVRNPEFPNNYIEHIKSLMENTDFIFVSSHKTVRDALVANNIPHILIYPSKDRKEEFIENYKARGNNEDFINYVSDSWNEWLDDIETTKDCNFKFKFNYGFISDNIDNLNQLYYLKSITKEMFDSDGRFIRYSEPGISANKPFENCDFITFPKEDAIKIVDWLNQYESKFNNDIEAFGDMALSYERLIDRVDGLNYYTR